MNSGDGIDYHQRFSENIGDLIEVRAEVGEASGLGGRERLGALVHSMP